MVSEKAFTKILRSQPHESLGMTANAEKKRVVGSGSWAATDEVIELLLAKKLPNTKAIIDLCERAKEMFSKEPNIVRVDTPVTIVGDIHGQFYDLKEVFEVAGMSPEANYLFLGDYVDRGYFSVETILLLFALKTKYPRRVTMLRGNHETRQITQVYGFYDECMKKFGTAHVWTLCTDTFDCMPFAGVVHDAGVFAVHAGLSPSIGSLDELAKLDRKKEVPHEGPVCDLLWSDPEDIQGWGLSQRGAGYTFGGDVVSEFLHLNRLGVICRSHQLVMEGYREMFNHQLFTVWSAPNYCYRCGNDGSVLTLQDTGERIFSVYGPAPAELRERPDEVFGNGKLPTPDYFL